MRRLRLPYPLLRSLRFPSLTESLAPSRYSLARAAESTAPAPGRCEPGVVLVRLFEGSVRLSQLSRIPPCASAPLSDPGPVSLHLACAPPRMRLIACSAMLSPLTRAGRPGRATNFRDSITRLWHLLHTLRALLTEALRNVRFRVAASLSRVGVIYPLGIVYMFHLPLVDFLMCCLLARLSLSSLSFSFVRGVVVRKRKIKRKREEKDLPAWAPLVAASRRGMPISIRIIHVRDDFRDVPIVLVLVL